MKTLMNFTQFYTRQMNEDGDGGGGDFGGDFGGDTPSNTPGMGNPNPGGTSGDTQSSLGSGDTWSFAALFPNYMGNKKKSRKTKKIKNARKRRSSN